MMAIATDMRAGVIFICSIGLEDVERLEKCFATLTESGWVIPKWLTDLRNYVEHKLELI
jgi:hypothetical protein